MTARAYDNQHRQAQASATADRILAALVDLLLEERPTSVSIPAVATRAGVSVRTVYHHFPTKEDLFAALNPFVNRVYFEQVTAGEGASQALGLSELYRAGVPALIRAIPLFQALARAGIDHEDQFKRRNEQRLEQIGSHLQREAEGLSPEDLERLGILVASAASWPVVERLGRSGIADDDAADLVAWMVEALISHARHTGGVGADGRPRSGPDAPAAMPAATTKKTPARRSGPPNE